MFVIKKSQVLLKKVPYKHGAALVRHDSFWCDVEAAPPDPIFGVTEAYKADQDPNKVLLGVGAYRTDEGKPYILPSVRKAEEIILSKNMDHEYLVQSGLADFTKAAARLAFGEDSCVLKHGQNLTVQALSGTGALRLGAEFLAKFYPGCKEVYLPNPTWPPHKNIFPHAGLEVKSYRHYGAEKIEFDFNGACEDIKKMPEKAIILFHAIAHNPTGLDPNMEQWKELSKLCLEKKLFVFFDMAYQGFASGDSCHDASSVRLFIDDGHKIGLAQSFAKNMGLYGERIGAFTLLTSSKDEHLRLKSQMDAIIRAMYSNPPLYGARIVTHVLTDNSLKCQWHKDIKGMSERIKGARQMLVDSLKKAGSQRSWDHITRQIGMFSFTGLTKEQVAKLVKEHHVFLTANGRISIASLGSKNVEYVAKSMHEVTK